MGRTLLARLACRHDPGAARWSRREFLAGVMAASAGALLSGASGAASAQQPERAAPLGGGKRVLVIGAGLAGLICAHELRALGYEVLVLEGRRRVGGRVLSLTDVAPGAVVEGGGEWIGANQPTWLAAAKRFGIELRPEREDEGLDSPVVLDGRRLSDEESARLYDEMIQTLRSMDVDAAGVDADRPWLSPGAGELDGRSVADWLASQGVTDLTRRAIRVQLESNNGVALEAQSYLAQLATVKGHGGSQYWTQTEVYRAAGGAQQLAEALADAIGRERVRLGERVIRAAVARGRAFVVNDRLERYEADEIVIATSPAMWDRMDLFPGRPLDFFPQMGPAVKLLATVERRFWLEEGQAPDGLSDGDVPMTWEATGGQSTPLSVLTGFAGGPAADRLRQLPEGPRERAGLAGLAAMYPGLAGQRVRTRFMDWPTDRWTFGGYSFPAPGQVTGFGPLLHSPRGEPAVMHFAGEHCAYRAIGYMEGALWSGVEVARRIATRDGVIGVGAPMLSEPLQDDPPAVTPEGAPSPDPAQAPAGTPRGAGSAARLYRRGTATRGTTTIDA
ncbi:MAG: hypothetical protein C0475_01845 [Planctomyces sp.]|nr:hypothetical protein [Planctomyces sp.]MBA4039252.1 hypothetical protein [Planctomyces sp.]MBA4119608.1 hypothetical protein [Isosphaera sp.]